jgi:hypothetical protein
MLLIKIIIHTTILKPQEHVMVQPSVSDEEVKTLFPLLTIVALPSGKNYIRKTPHP